MKNVVAFAARCVCAVGPTNFFAGLVALAMLLVGGSMLSSYYAHEERMADPAWHPSLPSLQPMVTAAAITGISEVGAVAIYCVAQAVKALGRSRATPAHDNVHGRST